METDRYQLTDQDQARFEERQKHASDSSTSGTSQSGHRDDLQISNRVQTVNTGWMARLGAVAAKPLITVGASLLTSTVASQLAPLSLFAEYAEYIPEEPAVFAGTMLLVGGGFILRYLLKPSAAQQELNDMRAKALADIRAARQKPVDPSTQGPGRCASLRGCVGKAFTCPRIAAIFGACRSKLPNCRLPACPDVRAMCSRAVSFVPSIPFGGLCRRAVACCRRQVDPDVQAVNQLIKTASDGLKGISKENASAEDKARFSQQKLQWVAGQLDNIVSNARAKALD